MKKILICINNMKMGGIQKSLLELLKQIENIYDVTLFSISPDGELLKYVPKGIKIKYANRIMLASELTVEEAKKEGIPCFITKVIGNAWSRVFTKKIPAYIVTKFFQNRLGIYDVAISFSQPVEEHQFYMLSNEVVLNSCKAHKKITFLHCDFKNYGGNSKLNREMYKKFDRIAAVSDSVGNRFLSILPELNEKIRTVYNCHDYKEIERLASISPIIYKNKAIITVSRLSAEKGIIRVLPLLKRLIKKGYDISWHIVGDGSLYNEIKKIIKELNLEDRVFLYGIKENPYRYMKNATVFLLPSFHEAAPMVFDEAKTLHIPIITTNTLSAHELVSKHKDGFVCENTDEAIYKALKAFFDGDIDFNLSNFQAKDNKVQLAQFSDLVD